ncbi:FtsW/RodA/SpoVE family cell cycle protein [Leucobacter sp. M11]|uniref:FtsW/RodA/SpoVE family cell cycle protein n=1 Tax=Leucobacter sp. M11 TaxID=2993565 RepID=UPI002D7E2B91|nr:FtsW/RodA/SpoVE family cell cycle protein [Leucobacter sp. M11]MEB4613110.1 FtsW/RodA/SpoVE family cell cycle protein [Leucobacter sp. M11]
MLTQTVVLPAAHGRGSLVPVRPGRLRRLTLVLLSVVLLLVGVGVLMVQSASQVEAISAGRHPLVGVLRQGSFAVLGLALKLAVSRVPTAVLRRLSWVALLLGYALQLLVYTPLGYEAGGNRNWLRLGPLSMQPAEFMKVVLLVWVASVIAAKGPLLRRWTHVVIPIVPVVALSMLINILGGDLGTLMIIAALVFGALFFAQVRLRILAALAGVALLGIGLMTVIKPNRVVRILHFFEVNCQTEPEHAFGGCWQSLNGFWALAQGGMLGTGIGNSTAKWLWLPEAENDFVFAILGEELGYLGAMIVLAAFVVLATTLLGLMAVCRTPFARAVLGGLTVWIGGQMAVNIAVVLGFVPVLGVPLPFISAGGTALLSLLLALGVVLACVREAAQERAADPAESPREAVSCEG